EYCAAQLNESGVLILSEFAGAAAELRNGALLVNPHDIGCTAERIYQALVMPREERRERMRRLRRSIRNHDVFQWAEAFLAAAAGPGSLVSPKRLQAEPPRTITPMTGWQATVEH
ncbi:MAG TPA: trehalose-6-phosphate synthase, partial [Nitrococcus sp.]|nr:trehalose-6-phosphate synthase [Nitrococcus sp.]